jgi:hypothetical protein
MRNRGASERSFAAAPRQLQALELRRQGATYRQIAVRLGYTSPNGAYKAVQAALARGFRKPAQAVRDLENNRLDQLQTLYWQRALDGDLQALDQVLKVSSKRCAINGLYAPRRA